jgi:hypothetical protein
LTNSTDFPTQNPLQGAKAGAGGPLSENDVFVSKLNAAGSALLYSTYLGGTGTDQAAGIVVDGSGNAYVTGSTTSTNFPTQSALHGANAGAGDVFVSKLNAAGSALLYSTYLGGSGDDQGTRIAVDGSGNAYVTGYTSSTDFPTQGPPQATNAGGTYDVFVSKLNAAGSALLYSTYLGGTGGEAGNGIAVDGSGNAYVTGYTSSTNFPTQGPLQAAHAGGGGDVFVSKLTFRALGAACTLAAQCLSQLCADGVCCDAACNDSCDRCDLAGAVGKCTPAPAGSPGANPACSLGYVCDGVTAACTSCTTDTQCASTHYCAANGTCEPRKPQASACNTAAGADCKTAGCRACASGYCVDGLCCDKACTGQCEACDQFAGSCGAIDGKPHGGRPDCAPGNECSSKVNQCERPSVATCDGDHTTIGADGTKQDCAPYKCDSTGACLKLCASVSDCVAPTVCDATGKCVAPADAGGDSGGCSVSRAAYAQPRDASPLALAIVGALAAFARRRRRRGVATRTAAESGPFGPRELKRSHDSYVAGAKR